MDPKLTYWGGGYQHPHLLPPFFSLHWECVVQASLIFLHHWESIILVPMGDAQTVCAGTVSFLSFLQE